LSDAHPAGSIVFTSEREGSADLFRVRPDGTALERLTETSRAVVWLHDVEGYTHEEIATMMGKTPSFSKSQLARAHVRLRRWLGEEVAV